jgi:hypothetical protein
MAVTYRAFTNERTQLKVLVEFLEAQERDHYVHIKNKDRYTNLLVTAPEGAYKIRLQRLLADVNEKIEQVEAVINVTQAQLPANGEVDQIMAEIIDERNSRRIK